MKRRREAENNRHAMKQAMYPCNFPSQGVYLALLRGAVREAGKNVFCVQLVEGKDCERGARGCVVF